MSFTLEVLFASSLLSGAHLFLNLSHVNPVAGIVCMGAAYSVRDQE